MNASRGNTDAFANPANAPVLAQSRLDIQSGGKLIVDNGAGIENPEIIIGQEENADGLVVVNGLADPLGARSEIILTGGAAGQQAAFFSVGLRGTGELQILGGARVTIDGQAGDFPGMNIGGSSQSLNGDGTVLVAGEGSELIIKGTSGILSVGRSGTGMLTVSGGADVMIFGSNGLMVAGFDVGFASNGVGTAVVTGSGSTITLQGEPGGIGGSMDIGREGTGSLSVLDGATVSNDPTGVTTIGREVTGVGTVLVAGTDAVTVSTWNAGAFLVIAEDFDFTAVAPLGAGTGGAGTLTIGAFGLVNADQVFVGTDGTVGGVGTLAAATTTLDGGTIVSGFSAGTLSMSGDFIVNSGTLDIGLGGTGAGQSDLIDVFGTADLLGGIDEFTLIDGYIPGANDAIVFLSADGGLTGDLAVAVSSVTIDFAFDVTFGANDAVFIALNDAVAGDSTIFHGSSGDDVFTAGAGDDLLDGGGGSDTLTGGTGADTFVYGEGDGGATLELADLLTDFEDGTDLIGLEGGLTFADLTIDQSSDVVGDATNDTIISVTIGGEFLAVLDGITTTINADDFTTIM